MGAAALIIAIIVIVIVGTAVAWAIQRYGWQTVKTKAAALPRTAATKVTHVVQAARRLNIHDAYQLIDGRVRLQHYGFGRKRGGTTVEAMRFAKYSDPVHKFSFLYPENWTVARSDQPAASIVVQLTCNSDDESYKRFSVAWDDCSWSATTAELFGTAVAQQLPNLVPGSQLLSHGPYQIGTGGGFPPLSATPPRNAATAARTSSGAAKPPPDAYQLVYRISDPVDSSVLQLLNVVFVSTHGGRRRAYTVTFGSDADAYQDVLRLARHMIDSFAFEDDDGDASGYDYSSGAANARGATSPAKIGRAATASSADGEEVHINVWERQQQANGSDGGYVAPSADGGAGTELQMFGRGKAQQQAMRPTETSQVPSEVAWMGASLPQAGLAYVFPSHWLQSQIGCDDASLPVPSHYSSYGFAAPNNSAAAPSLAHVRRWTVYHSCDRRESCFKGMSIVCVDVTPLLELLCAASGIALSLDPQTAAVLLQYLLYRYRCEAADNDALTQGVPPSGAPLTTSDEAIRPWLDAFGQRWPLPCRLSSPIAAHHVGGEPSHSISSGAAAGNAVPSTPGHHHSSSSGTVASVGGGLASRFSSYTGIAGARASISSTGSGSIASGGAAGAGINSASTAAAMGDLVACPHQTCVVDVRTVAASRLLKVSGWLRSSATASSSSGSGGFGPSGTISPSLSRSSRDSSASFSHGHHGHHGGGGGGLNSSRRYSTYSTISIDNMDSGGGLPAEGQLITTTSAVLLGIHEAMVPVPTAAAASAAAGAASSAPVAAAAAAPLHRRVFGHVVTFSTSADTFARYEPLAKHVFQSLEAVVA